MFLSTKLLWCYYYFQFLKHAYGKFTKNDITFITHQKLNADFDLIKMYTFLWYISMVNFYGKFNNLMVFTLFNSSEIYIIWKIGEVKNETSKSLTDVDVYQCTTWQLEITIFMS